MKRDMRKAVEEGAKVASNNTRLDLSHSEFYQLFGIMAEAIMDAAELQGISVTWEKALDQGKSVCCEAAPAISAAYYAGLAVGLRQRKKDSRTKSKK